MSPLCLQARLRRRQRRRGSTLVEFALVIPILISLILYSLFLTELIRVKLRLLEVVRFAAWELTSYPLSDYRTGNPGRAFERSNQRAGQESEARYKSLDSVEPTGNDFIARFDNLRLHITQAEVPWIETSGLSALGQERGGWSQEIFEPLSSGPRRVLESWGFNTSGKLRIEASGGLRNRLLPQHFLDQPGRGFFQVDFFGGRDLGRIRLQGSMTLIADGWTLPDGADSMMKGSRSGQHREGNQQSGLYRQVRRMSFLGIRDQLEHVPAVSSVLGLLHSVAPDPMGTYVVSHNYAPDPQGPFARACDGTDYPQDAAGGLNNLAKFATLDADRPRCFDTAPFRDQASYADSLYIQMFAARGSWFMGCKNAQGERCE
jgi:hypothetical protein